MIEKPLASGTKLLAMKGVYPHDEIAELQQNNILNTTPNKTSSDDLHNCYNVESVTKLTVPGIESQRHLVLIGQEAAVKRTNQAKER